MTHAFSCPNSNDLRSYIKGDSSDLDIEAIENHLASCQRCQVHIEILSEESDSLVQMVSAAAKVSNATEVSESRTRPFVRSSKQSGYQSKPIDPLTNSSVMNDSQRSITMIQDFRLLELIGKGGMGEVYRAVNVISNQQCAIKLLKPERMETPEALSRFRREIKILAQLKHRNIVGALHAGEHDGRLFLVMDYVRGVNLNQLVRRIGPLPVPEACAIIRLVANALQFAHEQKVIHRDIKPSNVMVTVDGEVKLLDLGLAQSLRIGEDDSLSRADQVLGTVDYMSPEQLKGGSQVSVRSDIFSLGIMLRELLTGERLRAEASGIPPIVSEASSSLVHENEHVSALVRDLTAWDPLKRPASMEEVAKRLEAISPMTDLTYLTELYERWEDRSGFNSRPDYRNANLQLRRNWIQSIYKNPLAGIIAGVCLSAIVIALTSRWNQTALLETKAVELGTVTAAGVGKVGTQLLSQGNVKAKGEDGQVFDLLPGENRLPFGRYSLLFINTPVDLDQAGEDFEVFKTATSTVEVSPILRWPFQYPDIPDEPGAFHLSHGSIWRAGWLTEDKLTFSIHLEVLAVGDQSKGDTTKWLKLEVISKGIDDRIGSEDYTETAYLNFDAVKWRNSQELQIREGWITASSDAIEKHLRQASTTNPSDREVVVRFDRQHDLLVESSSVPLPARRLSTFDVLALVFGQEIPAAGGAINAIRGTLPNVGARKTSLQLLDFGRGEQQCFVVSSRDQYNDYKSPGFTMARLKNDFGFGLLQVNLPGTVEAIFLKKTGSLKRTGNTAVLTPDELQNRKEQLQRRLEQLRQNGSRTLAEKQVVPKPPRRTGAAELVPAPWLKKWPKEIGIAIGSFVSHRAISSEDTNKKLALPFSSTKFDIALLPKEPSKQVFHGIIKLNPNHMEYLSVVVQSLGEETIGGRLHRWIDLEVISRFNEVDYSEFARVLIDTKEYEDSGDFLIKKGWIAFGARENVVAIPSDLNLDSIIDKRLRHQPKPEWNRIGAVDTLSMLFNAKLKPRTSTICTLRDKFAGMLAGLKRAPTYDKPFQHKSGEMLTCERWASPLSLPNLNYTFLRTAQMPFGFLEVTLNIDSISIQLDTESYRRLRPEEWSDDGFGTPAPEAEIPNWQVWTWIYQGKTYKAWAEFGGKIQSNGLTDVILRDAEGIEIRVPLTYFSKEGQVLMNRGRHWGKKPFRDSNIPQWRNLANYDAATKKVTFDIGDPSRLVGCELNFLELADQVWIEKLQAAKTRRFDANDTRSWQSFAGYVR